MLVLDGSGSLRQFPWGGIEAFELEGARVVVLGPVESGWRLDGLHGLEVERRCRDGDGSAQRFAARFPAADFFFGGSGSGAGRLG